MGPQQRQMLKTGLKTLFQSKMTTIKMKAILVSQPPLKVKASAPWELAFLILILIRFIVRTDPYLQIVSHIGIRIILRFFLIL